MKHNEEKSNLEPILDTPVLLIVFNRPETTRQVFESIKKVRPAKLYIAADGPRLGKSDDLEKCMEVKRIVTSIDWECQLKTLFRDQNLGCKVAVSSSIDWFFEHVEEGIIVEDDCICSQSFFWFCKELLERYRDDERIFAISGSNWNEKHERTEFNYYFSIINHIWGWATWKRAWKYYDVKIHLWPTIRDGRWLWDVFQDRRTVRYFNWILDSVYNNRIDTWDYQWFFTCWVHSGLVILPSRNLVSNIGFGPEATHTFYKRDGRANLIANDVTFPLKHPNFIIIDRKSDNYIFSNYLNKLFSTKRWIQFSWIRIWKIFSGQG